MALFSHVESRIKRGIMLLSGLAAAGLLVLLAVLVLSPSQDIPPTRAKRKKPARVLTPHEARVVEAEIYRPVPISQAPAGTDEARLARAMDDSNSRMLVQTLIEAAATENASLKASMLGALGRSAVSPRPILESELDRAETPSIKRALEEALARCR